MWGCTRPGPCPLPRWSHHAGIVFSTVGLQALSSVSQGSHAISGCPLDLAQVGCVESELVHCALYLYVQLSAQQLLLDILEAPAALPPLPLTLTVHNRTCGILWQWKPASSALSWPVHHRPACYTGEKLRISVNGSLAPAVQSVHHCHRLLPPPNQLLGSGFSPAPPPQPPQVWWPHLVLLSQFPQHDSEHLACTPTLTCLKTLGFGFLLLLRSLLKSVTWPRGHIYPLALSHTLFLLLPAELQLQLQLHGRGLWAAQSSEHILLLPSLHGLEHAIHSIQNVLSLLACPSPNLGSALILSEILVLPAEPSLGL